RTFLREFEAVPGMAAVYREWQRRGYAFHYVSGSPWQLYPPLLEFMQAAGFPVGSFHLRMFRLKGHSVLDFIRSDGLEYKSPAITDLLQTYPDRRFILVGDSGEQDPEVYARIAHQFPDQVKAIFIRDVTGEQVSHTRYRNLAIPAHIPLRVFQEAGVLQSLRITGL
ncbi:MAG: App1 family protein, partial [Leptospiraceae bacterium]|nr:App1 family protein [Leptospiraceae bacterium]